MFIATASRWRPISLLAAVVMAGALTTDAAVLPLADDLLIASRPDLQTAPLPAVAGQWVGHTQTGRLVSLVLRVDQGTVAGDATLEGIVPDAKGGPTPLVTPTVSGRRMAFAVQPGPCARALTHGVVTFAPDGSAELDLRTGKTPITIRLSKVG